MTFVTVLLIAAVVGVWTVGIWSIRQDNRRIASARSGFPGSQRNLERPYCLVDRSGIDWDEHNRVLIQAIYDYEGER